MTKPIIAVDIDDVLAAAAAGWVAYSNKQWGTSLKVEDYDEDWAKMWRVDFETAKQRAHHIHATKGIVSSFAPDATALVALQTLSESYELVIATSRITTHKAETEAWLDEHFKGVFSGLHLSNIYKAGNIAKDAVHGTKAELVDSIGAAYLIDDQLKHCLAVAERGRQAILFGDYGWNRTDALPVGVTRCADWAAIVEYFDGQR